MSGIAGIYRLDGQPVEEHVLREMTEAIAYRGPDGINHWVQGPIGLGHLQLCTTPESLRERQPLVSPDGSYAIVCDGRVDNRDELIWDLRSRAPVTPDSTDVELILHAYIAWGADCVKRIVGDFVFVIWDQERQRLFCGRDPMGVRLLYYFYDGNQFIFGSEIHELLKHPAVPRESNELLPALYLLGKIAEDEQTFFKGIMRVPAAGYLVLDRSGIRKERYWTTDPSDTIKLSGDQEYEEAFRDVFNTALRARLRSCSPVGMTLSGGLDSSTIASSAGKMVEERKLEGIELHTYSAMGSKFEGTNEGEYLDAVLEKYPMLRPHFFSADDFWGYKPLQKQYPLWDEPYPVPYRTRHEALWGQAFQDGVRVMLTGEGGDELLAAGTPYLMDLFHQRHFLRFYQEVKLIQWPYRWRFYKRLFWSVAPQLLARAYGFIRRVNNERRMDPWINRDFINRIGALEHARAIHPPWLHKDSLYQQLTFQTPFWIASTPWVRYSTSMAYRQGIEVRHPFYDKRLVDFLTRIPPDQKFKRGWTKRLMRRAMKDILPETVRRRVGKADYSPLGNLGMLDKELRRINGQIAESRLARMGLLDPQALAHWYRQYPNGEAGNYTAGFILTFSLEDWLREVEKDTGDRAPVASGY